MKLPLINKLEKWGLVLLSIPLFTAGSSSAQFVEVTVQFEGASWFHKPSGQDIEYRQTNTVRCVFGTNLWLIEGEIASGARETWWCTGTNIIKQMVITREAPERAGMVDRAFKTPRLGERSTRIYDPLEKRPLGGIAQLSWLSFCSGDFLRSKGRRIQVPFDMPGLKEEEYSDKTELFETPPGLPRRIDLFKNNQVTACRYEVIQSTNFAGWTIPVRFEYTQSNDLRRDPAKPFWHGAATVTSIRNAPPPLVPPEVMKPQEQ